MSGLAGTMGMNRRAALRMGGVAALGSVLPDLAWAAAQPGGLENLRSFAEKWVGPGKLPGLVVAVGMPGRETSYIAEGAQGFLDSDAMAPDTLFRIYSMTKPVTGMATMMLIDDGRLGLDQPLSSILPEFAEMQVQTTYDGSLTDVVPAERAITIRHLLTHTSGLSYGIIQQGPIRDALFARGLIPGIVTRLPVPGLSRGNHVKGLKAFSEGMAKLPLVHQPGTRWSYSSGLDLLGYVIERASGQTFDSFLKERLFDPLGMADTGFQVPRADAGRLATNYGVLGGKLIPIDGGDDSIFLDPPPFLFGGSGLVSTPRDYDRFLRMIGQYGMFEGKRVMGELAVRVGTSNLLPSAVEAGEIGTMRLDAFGAGGRVGRGAESGIFGWSGAAGTVGMVDMNSGLTSAIYVQFMPPNALDVLPEFQQALRADVMALLGRK